MITKLELKEYFTPSKELVKARTELKRVCNNIKKENESDISHTKSKVK